MSHRSRLAGQDPDDDGVLPATSCGQINLIVTHSSKRVGRDADDFEVVIFVGAFLGGMISAFVSELEDPDAGLLGKLDRAFEYMQDRLHLDPPRP